MPRDRALFEKVYDVLVKHAGANEYMREHFVHMTSKWTEQDAFGTWEFRFMGSLGMGGKFWLTCESFHVSAYAEDINEKNKRQDIINTTNAELAKLYVVPLERRL